MHLHTHGAGRVEGQPAAEPLVHGTALHHQVRAGGHPITSPRERRYEIWDMRYEISKNACHCPVHLFALTYTRLLKLALVGSIYLVS